MTTYSDAITIVHRLKVWIADERMGDGALLKKAADLIEQQAARIKELEIVARELLSYVESDYLGFGGKDYSNGAISRARAAIDAAILAENKEPESKLSRAIKLARGGEAPPPHFNSGINASRKEKK